jgi:hypothetical protein
MILIKPHPSWYIIDGTKIAAFQTCPRKYLFEHILGWQPPKISYDLFYGQCFHYALEEIYEISKAKGHIDYSEETILRGYNRFLKEFRKEYGELDEIPKPAKTPENTLRALLQYGDQYKNIDRFEVIQTEISGSVQIGEHKGQPQNLYFRLDTLCKDSAGYQILEHKTSSWQLALWKASFTNALQVGTGQHVTNCYAIDAPLDKFVINGFLLNKNGKNQFIRLPFKWKPENMEEWMYRASYWHGQILDNIDILLHEDLVDLGDGTYGIENASFLRSFQKNDKSEIQFNKPCSVMDYCAAWPNPLTRTMPGDFTQRFWDPREMDKSYER